jgi:hypothetical protein
VGTLLAVAQHQFTRHIAAGVSRPDGGYRPCIALIALVLLMAIARLGFGPRRPGQRLPPGSRTVADLGLLVPLRSFATLPDAEKLRDLLRENGVRASVSAEDSGFVVLVFQTDQPTARRLLQAQ